MVELGYVSAEEAELSFLDYWDNYDYTRSNITSAWFEREDKAPYFSEYVRQRLEELLLGTRPSTWTSRRWPTRSWRSGSGW